MSTLAAYEKTVLDGFHTLLDGVTSTYGAWMAGLFASSLTLFITYRAYQTLAGRLNRPVEEIMWEVGKMLVIMAFVTNAGGYLDMTAEAINGIRNGFSGDQSIWAMLDSIWERAQHLGQGLYNQDDSTYVPVNGAIAETVVWLSVAFLVGVSAFVNLIAELVLMLMLTTAPIFIFCLMWGWLRPTFNNWLQTILSCIFTSLFTGLALHVVITYINKIIDYATTVKGANMVTLAFQVGSIAVLSGLLVLVFYKLSCMLAGVAAQGAIQGMASAGIGRGFSSTTNVINSARNGAGAIGDRAVNNLKNAGISTAGNTSNVGAAAARQASIQNMIKNNAQRYK